MEIIFVTSALHGGGAERVLTTLANRFAGQGDHVIILMTAGDEVAYPLHPKVEAVCIGQASHGNPAVQLGRLFRIRKFLKAHSRAYVVSFSTTINLFTALASLGLKNRVILSERNDPNRCRYAGLRNLLYRLGDGFVFQTEEARDCFPLSVRKRSAVIPNPIRPDLPEAFAGERGKKIAAVGRLEPQKNHGLLLKAFAGFHKKYPDYTLHIFGVGSLQQALESRRAELGLEDCVILEGFHPDILERIRACGMYVLSSDYEGISNSLMEAMALGIPCISTDCPIGGSAMCITHEKNGLLVPVGDGDALQAAMERLAASCASGDGFAAKIGRNAVKIRDTFAEEKIAARWRRYIAGKR